MIGICHRDGIRAYVTLVIPGQTREPIEWIFNRYMPLDKSNPPQTGTPPPRGGAVGPEIVGSLWEGMGQVQAIATKYS